MTHAPDASAEAPVFSDAFRAGLAALFRWRRDVRRFRRDPLPPGALDALLAEAATAPSVGLSEPWRFVRVESEKARAAVRAEFARCNAAALAGRSGDDAALYAALKLEGLDCAPVQLAAFCDEETDQGRRLGAETMPETRRYSVVCAVSHLWLAARAAGIGVGWVSILDPERVRAALGAPDGWRLIAYLCIGWPEAEAETPELERAGWERRRGLAGKVATA
ncbi:MAG: 5,6-dimethylbenzimidazole synthase [Rhodobacteraceae bacterium]|nr:MAG: 5,6-dimethylbenzimidazole synthase [Paracoccaceae bacterium]